MDPRQQWLEEATRLATQAGTILRDGWRRAMRVEKKGRIDLVTEYDLRAEAFLRERMRLAFPEHGWVGEEGDAVGAEGAYTWFVDPLDGTTNFAHGHFFFAVSLGLAEGGVPSLGVVHAPALGVTWSGGVGLGAFRDGEPIAVSRASTLEDALVATGFPYDRATSPENNLVEARAIIPRVQGMRRCGAAALDLCLVADGTYDGYWEQKLNAWDVCAGMAIARAAGATLTDYEGRPVGAHATRLVVTNGALHPALLGAVQQARGEAALPSPTEGG